MDRFGTGFNITFKSIFGYQNKHACLIQIIPERDRALKYTHTNKTALLSLQKKNLKPSKTNVSCLGYDLRRETKAHSR